jgi:hypothetical protein
MKPSLCSLFQPAATSSLFGPNITLSTQFSNTLDLCSSLNVGDQVTHPYRTGKIMIFYFNIKFLERRQEDKTLN